MKSRGKAARNLTWFGAHRCQDQTDAIRYSRVHLLQNGSYCINLVCDSLVQSLADGTKDEMDEEALSPLQQHRVSKNVCFPNVEPF